MSTAPLHILVVDDDPIMTELLHTLFTIEGHTVTTVSSGEEALATLAGNSFDAVLTDLQLPGLHGAALVAALRKEINPATKLVGMSGTEPSAEDKAVYDAFLLKPFAVEDFTTALTTAKPVAGSKSVTLPAESTQTVLDEAIFARMAKQLPQAKLKELYQLTLDDIAERLNRIEEAENAGDFDTVRREAHAVKGGCGMVGATELHRLAGVREGGSAANTPPIHDFRLAWERLQRILDTRLNGY